MKLTDIDLNDKTEVAAAHALLAAILGASAPASTIGTAVHEVIEQNPALIFGAQTYSNDSAMNAALQQDAAKLASMGMNPMTGQSLQDPATVFGAAGAGVQATALPSNGGTLAAQPAAHITNEAAAVGLPAGVQLDSKGLPWDERIHAANKGQNKDGSWRAKKGLNDGAMVARIEAEIRQSAAPLPQTQALPASLPVAPTQALPVAATLAAIPAAAASPDPTTFEQLMPRVTSAVIGGALPQTALQQVCTLLGLPSIVALQQNPAYIPHAWAQLKAAYPSLQ